MTVPITPFGLTTVANWQHDTPLMLCFDSTNTLSYINGPLLAAEISTTEIQPELGKRVRIDYVRPLVDSNPSTVTPTIELGTRIRLRDPVLFTGAIAINVWGIVPANTDARYIRIKLSIPASTDWTHTKGADVSIADTTRR